MTFKPGAFKSNLLFLFVLLGALLLCMIAALMLGDYKISIAKILDFLNLKIFSPPPPQASKRGTNPLSLKQESLNFKPP